MARHAIISCIFARESEYTKNMARSKLQARVYDILLWRKVPESDARSVGQKK